MFTSSTGLKLISLSLSVTGIRLSGQDSERGTFNQRHAILFDQQTGRRCVHMCKLAFVVCIMSLMSVEP